MQDFVINQAKTGQQHAATVKKTLQLNNSRKELLYTRRYSSMLGYTRLTPKEEHLMKKAAAISQMLSSQTRAYIVV